MRAHAVIAAVAIVSALASSQPQAHAKASGIITCDRQGCRPEISEASRLADAAHRRGGRHRHRHEAERRPTHQRASYGETASGVVRSRKTGAVARVAARYVSRFQGYINDLEAHGASVYYMGGIRRGHCSAGSQHPCGSALDVCQDWRGHVSGARDCHLPRPGEMAAIAARHGLTEGGRWCRHPDYGHAQVIPSGSECEARGSWGHGRRLAKVHRRIRLVAR